MKYLGQEATCVLTYFQQFVKGQIFSTKYNCDGIFHDFTINEIVVLGKKRNHVRFKDSLVDDCQNMPLDICPPDINEIIDTCFVYI